MSNAELKKRHLVLVLTEPTEGQETEFNDYYENKHIDEVLETTGWLSGQRFQLADHAGESSPLPYLAVYEAEAENATEVIEQLNSSRPQREQSKALNRKTGRVWVFEPTGPEHKLS